VKIRILRSSYEDMISQDEVHRSPFKPGMSATVEIQTSRVANVVSVPIQAVTARDTSQRVLRGEPVENETAEPVETNLKEYVFVEKDGKAILTAVSTGIQDRMYIELKEGIADGEKIIVAPYSAISRNLKHEDRVEVVAKDKLFAKQN
jgi:HlyD family secretion protein